MSASDASAMRTGKRNMEFAFRFSPQRGLAVVVVMVMVLALQWWWC